MLFPLRQKAQHYLYNTMRKLIFILFLLPSVASASMFSDWYSNLFTLKEEQTFGAPYSTYQASILPKDSTENLGTTTAPWDELHVNQVCLSADCKTAWPSGSGSGSSFGQAWELYGSGTYLAPTTTKGFIVSASSTISALTVTNGTTTSATSTDLYVSGSTRLASLSGLLKASSGVVTTAVAGTDYQTFAYPFGVATNATSTLTQFNGGLTAYASSTISDLTMVLSTTTQATTTSLGVTTVNTLSSAGLGLYSNNGTQIGLFGAGGGANATFYDGVTVTDNLTVDTNTLYVDATNNKVGVGTTTPWAKLSVNPNGISGPAFAIGSSSKTYFQITNGGYLKSNNALGLTGNLFETYDNGLGGGIKTTSNDAGQGNISIAGRGDTGSPQIKSSSHLEFVLGDTSRYFRFQDNAFSSLVVISGTGMLGIGTTTPAFNLSVQGTSYHAGTTFLGATTTATTSEGYSGRISAWRYLTLSTATTTAGVASTTNSAYSPYIIAPFSGTIRQVRCSTDTSFLGVNTQIGGSNTVPSYFVASTTVGTITFTSSNTFTVGQKILMNVGTTTNWGGYSVSCTYGVTESP